MKNKTFWYGLLTLLVFIAAIGYQAVMVFTHEHIPLMDVFVLVVLLMQTISMIGFASRRGLKIIRPKLAVARIAKNERKRQKEAAESADAGEDE